MTRASLAGVLMLLVPGATLAQETDRLVRPNSLERSYIFARVPMDDLAFEAQLAPHLYPRRPDVWGTAADSLFWSPVTSWAVALTPMVRLRMMSTKSNPVRTPSYMPRPLGDWQFFRASVADPDAEKRLLGNAPLRLWALTVSPWAHHSNGQDGCLYTYQERGDDGECAAVEPPPERPTTNKLDGSFTTNFVSALLAYSYVPIPDDSGDALEIHRRCTYRFGAEWHPTGYLIGGIKDEQAEFYPQWQFVGGMEWLGLGGRLLLSGDVRLMSDPAPAPGTAAYTVEASWAPRRLSGWGFFTRYYRGMDYYNLGFLDSIEYLQFGLVWDAGSVEQLLLPEEVDLSGVSDPPPYDTHALLDGWLTRPLDGLCRLLH